MTTELNVLGSVELRADGQRVELGPAKQRCVLAVLLLADGQVSTGTLIDRVWGERSPAEARNALYSYLTRLRKALRGSAAGADIRRYSGGYLLEVPDARVDLRRFTALAERAAGESDERRAERLGEALRLWRGEPLTGLSGGWVERERAGLHRLRVTMLAEWAGLRLAAGAAAEVVHGLRAAVGEYPLAEALTARFLLALHRTGETGEALDRYAETVRRLAEQLGAEPGPALLEVHRELESPSASRTVPAERASVPVPAQLPSPPAGFVGRDAQLARLDGLAAEPPGILLVTGAPGVGKTALVHTWGHRAAASFPDGQLYLDLRGHAKVEPLRSIDALSTFLRALGVASARIPFDENAAAGLYRSLLAERRMLVVLDNAASTEQVRPLLPGTAGCVAVITSRERLSGLLVGEGARRMRLDSLRVPDAVALLADGLGADRVSAEPVAAAELTELCGCLPLALRIAVANLLDDDSGDIANYVAELRTETPLAALETDGTPSAVRSAFDLSYHRLGAEQQRMFRLLARSPGPDFTAETAAALAGTRIATARRLLDRLAGAHLIEPRDRARYAFHDLLRQYAIEQGTGEDFGPALHRLGEHYLRSADRATRLAAPALAPPELPAPQGVAVAEFPEERAALEWLDDERPNLVACCLAATALGRPELSWLLCGVLRGYFQIRSYHADWRSVVHAGVAAADLHGTPANRALAQLGLGYLHRYRGDEQAAAVFSTARELASGAGWRLGEAAALAQLGLIYPKLDRPEDAVDVLLRAVAVGREEGDAAIEGAAHGNLGTVYVRLGQPRRALPHLFRELELLELAGSRFREANALTDLGLAHAQLGEYPPAIRRHRRALELATALGHRPMLANAQVNLAAAYLESGLLAEAAEQAGPALRLAKQLRVRDTEAEALSVLAAAVDPGRHPEALLAARECDDHRLLAEVATRYAERDGAEPSDVDDALAVARAHGYRIFEARALLVQSRLLGDPGPAQRSLALCRETGYRPGEARALLLLDRSSTELRTALALFEEMDLPEAAEARARLSPS
ncbi:AfsR/SARP family transcriptional regulator [Amycolatopsis nigrescens]|uniref:AfsR/SARP family transcriptional regulator n=1 Tax=Amycolatopsis nigrescens TaxID=381445 RepID=UPI00036085A5|nr:BTAD domain-containing putative transcriptional regulator [Amycolatopsis nigrescens]